MPAVDTVVPIVANIHWDSILKEFVLRISTMLEESTGNKREKDDFHLEDFASVLLKIYEIWVLAHAERSFYLDFPLGDLTPLVESFTALMLDAPSQALNTNPDPYVDDSAFDVGDFEPPTDWGETA